MKTTRGNKTIDQFPTQKRRGFLLRPLPEKQKGGPSGKKEKGNEKRGREFACRRESRKNIVS